MGVGARKTLAALAGCALTVVLARPTPADALDQMTGEERGLARAVLAEREWNQIPAGMILDGDLTAQAQKQAEHLSRCACTEHSPNGELGWYLNRGWDHIGENVAGGFGTPYAAHLALVASPPHLANLLGDFDGFGVAIRRDRVGAVYVVEVFGSVA